LRNVRVERVDPEKNLIFVRGPVPGSRNSLVLIRKMG
jgi:ribosomal protein L3